MKQETIYKAGQVTAVVVLIGSFFIRWWLPLVILGIILSLGIILAWVLEQRSYITRDDDNDDR